MLKNHRLRVDFGLTDFTTTDRLAHLGKLRELTSLIEGDVADEPDWDHAVSDHELLSNERLRRLD